MLLSSDFDGAINKKCKLGGNKINAMLLVYPMPWYERK